LDELARAESHRNPTHEVVCREGQDPQRWKTEAFIARDSPSQIIVSPEAQNLQGGLIEDVRRHCAG